MNIIIISATPFEAQPLQEKVAENGLKNIYFHISGVGILQSCFSIQKIITEQKPDFIIQIGIAGSYDKQRFLGDVAVVEEEFLGSCGVEENGEWKDIFDLKFGNKNQFPFEKSGLKNPFLETYNLLHLPEVKAVTVDEITTAQSRIQQLKNKYNPSLESMEGASLHYCASQYNIPFLQMRGISNYTGERNKTNWKIKDAIQNVCEKGFELLRKLNG